MWAETSDAECCNDPALLPNNVAPGQAETISNDQKQNSRPCDPEDRTFAFEKSVWAFVKKLPRSAANIEDGRQLIRALGSVGAMQ